MSRPIEPAEGPCQACGNPAAFEFPEGRLCAQCYDEGRRPGEVVKARTPRQHPEEDLQKQVIELAQRTGWKVCHHRPARAIEDGEEVWRTPVQGDAGVQDLVLARRGVVKLRELKSDTGRLTPEEKEWAEAAGKFGGVWRPHMWNQIVKELE